MAEIYRFNPRYYTLKLTGYAGFGDCLVNVLLVSFAMNIVPRHLNVPTFPKG